MVVTTCFEFSRGHEGGGGKRTYTLALRRFRTFFFFFRVFNLGTIDRLLPSTIRIPEGVVHVWSCHTDALRSKQVCEGQSNHSASSLYSRVLNRTELNVVGLKLVSNKGPFAVCIMRSCISAAGCRDIMERERPTHLKLVDFVPHFRRAHRFLNAAFTGTQAFPFPPHAFQHLEAHITLFLPHEKKQMKVRSSRDQTRQKQKTLQLT